MSDGKIDGRLFAEAIKTAGLTGEQVAEIARLMGPYMPELPVPSRWAAFKRWLRRGVWNW